jgi:hypothetical protein
MRPNLHSALSSMPSAVSRATARSSRAKPTGRRRCRTAACLHRHMMPAGILGITAMRSCSRSRRRVWQQSCRGTRATCRHLKAHCRTTKYGRSSPSSKVRGQRPSANTSRPAADPPHDWLAMLSAGSGRVTPPQTRTSGCLTAAPSAPGGGALYIIQRA